MDDRNHRSMAAKVINQKVAARDVNKMKPRNLQIQLTVADKSLDTLDNTRDVRPDRIAIIPAMDEARKAITHGFERSVR